MKADETKRKREILLGMNNRYTPFGYCIRDGKTTVVSSEAEVITKIYSLYLSGES